MTAEKLKQVIFVSCGDLSDTSCPHCLHNRSLFHAAVKIKRKKKRNKTKQASFLGHLNAEAGLFSKAATKLCTLPQLTAWAVEVLKASASPLLHYLFSLLSFCWVIYELQTGGPGREEEEERGEGGSDRQRGGQRKWEERLKERRWGGKKIEEGKVRRWRGVLCENPSFKSGNDSLFYFIVF